LTQQNAALVEESAAAAKSLRDQAKQLAQDVAVLKISGSVMSFAAEQPARDITPHAEFLTYKRPQPMAAKKPAAQLAGGRAPIAAKPALKLASSPAKRPVAPAAAPMSSAKAAPPAKSSADDEWETF
jgi:hypothetical protein